MAGENAAVEVVENATVEETDGLETPDFDSIFSEKSTPEVTETPEVGEVSGTEEEITLDTEKVEEETPKEEVEETPEAKKEEPKKEETPEVKQEKPTEEKKPGEIKLDQQKIGQTEQVQQAEALTPEQVKEQRTQWENQLTESYQMSDEEVELFQDNPREFLPRLAARVQMAASMDIIQAIGAMIPQYIQQFNAIEQSRAAFNEAFYSKWEQLNDAKYNDIVNQAVSLVRQMNPQATMEQIVNQAGAAVIANLGDELLQTTVETETVETTGTKPAAKKPYKPAKPGSTTVQKTSKPTGKKDENVFADLTEEFDQE